MVSKYLCLADNCHYMTESEDEAKDHMKMGSDHMMVEVMPTDGDVTCRRMGMEEEMEEEEEEM